jgi:hypothetical protein
MLSYKAFLISHNLYKALKNNQIEIIEKKELDNFLLKNVVI